MSSLLHVLIDCTAIPVDRGGVGRYIEGLLGGFRVGDIALTLITQKRDHVALSALVPWATALTVPTWFTRRPLRFAWEQFGLPGVARRAQADVVHSPHYTFPLGWKGGQVVTLHDATFYSDPEAHRSIKRSFFRGWIRLAWLRKGTVVTPSAATAREVERFVGPPRATIEVAHLGVNTTRFRPPSSAQLDAFRRELGLAPGDTWFAFLGTIEPRKNLGALLDAHRALRTELGDATPKLLISGGRGWDKPALAQLDSLAVDSGVRELGYLPMDSLPALLGGAVAVIYPSLGEGFGLPVLEAMACGAAVITTDRLAIPEVGGDAVAYTGIDAASIMQAMRTLARDEGERNRLRALAVPQAAEFSWEATAEAHIEAYRSVATRPSA